MEFCDFVSMEFDKPDTDQCRYMPTYMQLIGEQATSDGNTTQPCLPDPQIQQRGTNRKMNREMCKIFGVFLSAVSGLRRFTHPPKTLKLKSLKI